MWTSRIIQTLWEKAVKKAECLQKFWDHENDLFKQWNAIRIIETCC